MDNNEKVGGSNFDHPVRTPDQCSEGCALKQLTASICCCLAVYVSVCLSQTNVAFWLKINRFAWAKTKLFVKAYTCTFYAFRIISYSVIA